MMVITLLPRPTSPWRTPDAGVGRKASKVTLLQMSAEQQPCSKAFRRLLRQPWTLSVILVRMGRGLCPGETSSVMTYRLASPATASRTSWKQFARSGTTLTSPLRMLCAASPVASSCTRPNLAGFPVGIALVTVNSSSSPTTSVSSTTSHAAELIIRPSPLRLRAAPVAAAPAPPAPTQDAPPPPAPSPSVAKARFALGMPPLPPGLPPSSEPQAASHPTAEPLATTTAAPPPHKAPPARTGPPPSPSSPFSPSSPASPAMPPPNRRPFNAYTTGTPSAGGYSL